MVRGAWNLAIGRMDIKYQLMGCVNQSMIVTSASLWQALDGEEGSSVRVLRWSSVIECKTSGSGELFVEVKHSCVLEAAFRTLTGWLQPVRTLKPRCQR
jgi:hypothetical protein